MNYLRIVYPTGEYFTTHRPRHRFAAVPGQPGRTRNPALAATWQADERKDCEAAARALGGRVEEYAPVRVIRTPQD